MVNKLIKIYSSFDVRDNKSELFIACSIYNEKLKSMMHIRGDVIYKHKKEPIFGKWENMGICLINPMLY